MRKLLSIFAALSFAITTSSAVSACRWIKWNNWSVEYHDEHCLIKLTNKGGWLKLESPKTVVDFEKTLISTINKLINTYERNIFAIKPKGWPDENIEKSDVKITTVDGRELTKNDIKANFQINLKFLNKTDKEFNQILNIKWTESSN